MAAAGLRASAAWGYARKGLWFRPVRAHSTNELVLQQLTPELAEDVSRTETVIFLDASSNGEPGSVRCEAVFPQLGELHFSHHLAPAEILGLCDRLYSAKPRAFLISIHGECFDHGQELSPTTVHALPQALAEVWRLMKRLSRESGLFTH